MENYQQLVESNVNISLHYDDVHTHIDVHP